MDHSSVNYLSKRYFEIKEEVTAYLKKVGYNSPKIDFIPISGWTGANLIESSFIMDFYKGPTLIEAIDNLQSLNKPTDK
jgi:elongation factor 1-alpha